MTEYLAMVEWRGADHSGRRDRDLIDSELAQLLDRRAPHYAAYRRPHHRAHAHRAGLAGGVEDRLIPAAIAVARDIVVDRDDLAMKGRVGGAFVDAGGHDVTIRRPYDHRAERKGRVTTRFRNRQPHRLFVNGD